MAIPQRGTELALNSAGAGKLTTTMADFEIRDLRVSVEGREIIKGVSLAVNKGEVHAVMGPNGSGKSTLSHTLMGHPNYKVLGGHVFFKGKDILTLQPEDRAKLGMFLALQYPVVVPGITMSNFLRTAINARRGYDGKDKSKAISVKEFRALLKNEMSVLRMDDSFLSRYVNEGFSGGEKKRAEILQMAVLKPEIAILDETDSGLDIDSIKFVSDAVNQMRGPDLGVLIITHYTRVLKFIKPDYVHVLVNGEFVRSGGPELADMLEAKGYSEWVKEPAPNGSAPREEK
jgi:Fe-S cluster assembly ATP-binding protein